MSKQWKNTLHLAKSIVYYRSWVNCYLLHNIICDGFKQEGIDTRLDVDKNGRFSFYLEFSIGIIENGEVNEVNNYEDIDKVEEYFLDKNLFTHRFCIIAKYVDILDKRHYVFDIYITLGGAIEIRNSFPELSSSWDKRHVDIYNPLKLANIILNLSAVKNFNVELTNAEKNMHEMEMMLHSEIKYDERVYREYEEKIEKIKESKDKKYARTRYIKKFCKILYDIDLAKFHFKGGNNDHLKEELLEECGKKMEELFEEYSEFSFLTDYLSDVYKKGE